MIQEDKNLLLKDLCARLPYGVKCKYYDCCEGAYDEGTIRGFERHEYMEIDGVCIHVEEVKPYLFPLSSMTEEQKQESPFESSLLNAFINGYISLFEDEELTVDDIVRMLDWLNKNHFDYRGLIPMGLAIDCTNLNIY